MPNKGTSRENKYTDSTHSKRKFLFLSLLYIMSSIGTIADIAYHFENLLIFFLSLSHTGCCCCCIHFNSLKSSFIRFTKRKTKKICNFNKFAFSSANLLLFRQVNRLDRPTKNERKKNYDYLNRVWWVCQRLLNTWFLVLNFDSHSRKMTYTAQHTTTHTQSTHVRSVWCLFILRSVSFRRLLLRYSCFISLMRKKKDRHETSSGVCV